MRESRHVFECAARGADERAKDALSALGWLVRAARVAGNKALVLERKETDHVDVSASGRQLSAGCSTFEEARSRVEADCKDTSCE